MGEADVPHKRRWWGKERGVIKAQYFAVCGKCSSGQFGQIDDVSGSQARFMKKLSDDGWRYSRYLGWLCRKCSGLAREEAQGDG